MPPASDMTAEKIVCVGAIVRDDVYHVETLPAAGIKIAASRYESRFGGPAATAAVAIANLHGVAAYWGRVGADAAGDAALSALRHHGVDCKGVAVVQGGQTRCAVVLVDKNGERCIVAYRKGLPEDAALLPIDPFDGVGVVLADSRWPEGAEAVLDRARAKGVISVDRRGWRARLRRRSGSSREPIISSSRPRACANLPATAIQPINCENVQQHSRPQR